MMSADDERLCDDGMEQKPDAMEQRLKVAKTTTHKASPIPQRAKFLLKFNMGGKKKTTTAQVEKKAKIKRDPSRDEEKKEEEMEVEERERGREDMTAGGEPPQGSMDTQPVKEMKVRRGGRRWERGRREEGVMMTWEQSLGIL